MNSSSLVRWFGFPATLVHGDSLVLDRWFWLKKRLPLTQNGETLLDVGCGSGAFTIGSSARGYHALGVSWDERNQQVAQERAELCGVESATFVIGDVRDLDKIQGLEESYDVLICLECVEHILDDLKLFRDMAARMKPGARLLLTTPNYYYHPITVEDRGPFLKEETGWHVRRGYTPEMLQELCERSGLVCAEVSYCGGFISQKVTGIWRFMDRLKCPTALKWLLTLPLRLLPFLGLDSWVSKQLNFPFFSIGLVAYKPRFGDEKRA